MHLLRLFWILEVAVAMTTGSDCIKEVEIVVTGATVREMIALHPQKKTLRLSLLLATMTIQDHILQFVEAEPWTPALLPRVSIQEGPPRE